MLYRRVLWFILCVLICFNMRGYAASKKVLYVDSYHQGYVWSDGIAEGIYRVLGCEAEKKDGSVITCRDNITLKIHRMDTKRFSGLCLSDDAFDEERVKAQHAYKEQAALKAKAVIDSWQPDVVMVSDDNAAKYLVAEYYKGQDLPFVICGVNWDASMYGFPCKNVTGMCEVALIPALLCALEPYAKGNRIGYLGGDTLTDHKDIQNIERTFGLTFDKVVQACTFAEWQKGFIQLQNEVDLLILNTTSGVKGFQLEEAEVLVLEHTAIPTGSILTMESTLALITYAKRPEEQGMYVAKTALKILQGAKPDDFKMTKNKRSKVFLHMPLAEKLGVKFPVMMVKHATLIQEDNAVIAQVP